MHPGFPDFGQPPRAWTVSRAGAALRLVPPGAYPDRSRASMFVSPLVPVSPAMPVVETILRQALGAEVAQTGLAVESESPISEVSAGDLLGSRLEVAVRHPGAQLLQRRIYTMFRDASWLYGIHFVADEEVFDFFLPEYEAMSGSIRLVPAPAT